MRKPPSLCTVPLKLAVGPMTVSILVEALPPGAEVMVGRLVEDVAVFSLPNMRNPPH
jgi:hypothetical protein